MTQYKRIGIDTSKAVFTLHGIDHQERPVLRTNLSGYTWRITTTPLVSDDDSNHKRSPSTLRQNRRMVCLQHRLKFVWKQDSVSFVRADMRSQRKAAAKHRANQPGYHTGDMAPALPAAPWQLAAPRPSRSIL